MLHALSALCFAILLVGWTQMSELPWLDHLIIVRNDYIPRLQEAHATMYHLLLEAIGRRA